MDTLKEILELSDNYPLFKNICLNNAGFSYFKGLEFKAVIVFEPELLDDKWRTGFKDKQRNYLYVALTRAEEYLVVAYTQTSAIVNELKEIAEKGLMDFIS